MSELALNGSGRQEIAWVVQVGPNTGSRELQKSIWPLGGNKSAGAEFCLEVLSGEGRRVEAAMSDEMRSLVRSKVHQHWLWHALDHRTGVVLAYVWGS